MSSLRILDYNYVWAEGVTLTATSEDPSFPLTNLDLPSRSRIYRSVFGVKTASIVIDLGTPDVVDTAAILFDPSRAFPHSDDVTITLEANPSNLWTDPDFSEVLTLNPDAYSATLNVAEEAEYRYWRLTVSEPSEARNFVEIGKLVLGRSTELSTLPAAGFSYGISDRSKVDETPYGHKYVDLYPLQKRLTLQYPLMPYSDVQLLETVYRRAGRALPVLIIMDPEGDLFDPSHLSVYGTLASSAEFTHVGVLGFSHTLSIEEIV